MLVGGPKTTRRSKTGERESDSVLVEMSKLIGPLEAHFLIKKNCLFSVKWLKVGEVDGIAFQKKVNRKKSRKTPFGSVIESKLFAK